MKTVMKSSIAVIVALGLGMPMLANGAAPSQGKTGAVKVRFADLDIESEGQRFGQRGFANARHIFDQYMAACDQAGQQ